ncbi:MAG: SDR family oxidoreductase [Brevefilum sp.]
MIMITGGTGFIGNVLIRQLSNLGYPIKLLIRPSKASPNLPTGMPVEVAIASLSDAKGLRAAMKGVDVIYHLASAESLGRKAQLTTVDIQGTDAIVQAASQAKIERFFYVSHLGADRASAYPLLKAKAIAEHTIKSANFPYTIFRSAVAYGEQDHFTNGLAVLLKLSPYFVMLPGEDSTLLQPIWVEDLATIMTWALDMPHTINETIEVGGPEYLSFKEICTILSEKININRQYINVPPVFLNMMTEILEIITPNFPTSVFWLDYLASNRTTAMDVLPRMFSLIPALFNQRIGYLEGKNFRKNWWKYIFMRKRPISRWD